MQQIFISTGWRWRQSVVALLLLVGFLLSAVLWAANAPATRQVAAIVTIHDAIGPATADFFTRALQQANADGDVALILELDTPGGLDTSMRAMIQAILASNVPVVICPVREPLAPARICSMPVTLPPWRPPLTWVRRRRLAFSFAKFWLGRHWRRSIGTPSQQQF